MWKKTKRKTLIISITALLFLIAAVYIYISFRESGLSLNNVKELKKTKEKDMIFERVKVAVKETLNDSNVIFDEGCQEQEGQFWCSDSREARISSSCEPGSQVLKISAGKRNYGSWVEYWELQKKENDDLKIASDAEYSKIKGYKQVIRERLSGQSEECLQKCSSGNYKRVRESFSIYYGGYSFDLLADVFGGGTDVKGKILVNCLDLSRSLDQLAEKIMVNLAKNIKNYY